jgi:hypothetical protein
MWLEVMFHLRPIVALIIAFEIVYTFVLQYQIKYTGAKAPTPAKADGI